MTHASPPSVLEANLMDTWLVANHHKTRVNLGESNVRDLCLRDLPVNAGADHWLLDVTLGNNSTWGSERLRKAVAETYPSVTPAQVLITAGVSEGIVAVCLTHYEAGANVVMPVPMFHALIDVPEKLGYEVRKLPLSPKDGFRLRPAQIRAALDERTRLVILNSPHNPTGVVYTYEEIMHIADAAQAVGATVVVDEHYRYLSHVPGQEALPSASFGRPNIVTLSSVGKCFGCTGIRVGWIIADSRALERYHHHKLILTHTIPLISDLIAAQILERRRELLDRSKGEIMANLRRLTLLAHDSRGGMVVHTPEAGGVAFVELPGVMDTLGFAQRLLDEHGVLVLPGESFDLPGFIRVRLGVLPEEFDRACAGMKALLPAA